MTKWGHFTDTQEAAWGSNSYCAVCCTKSCGLKVEKRVFGNEKIKKEFLLNIIVAVVGEYQWRERREIKGWRSLWQWRRLTLPRRWRTKSFRAPCPSSPPPHHAFSFSFFFLNPTSALFTLGFEVDCVLYLLIPIVTVAYAYFAMHMFFFPPSTSSCPLSLRQVSVATGHHGRPCANLWCQFMHRACCQYICRRFRRAASNWRLLLWTFHSSAALLTDGLRVKGVKTSPLDGQIDNYKRYILAEP